MQDSYECKQVFFFYWSNNDVGSINSVLWQNWCWHVGDVGLFPRKQVECKEAGREIKSSWIRRLVEYAGIRISRLFYDKAGNIQAEFAVDEGQPHGWIAEKCIQ